LEVEKSLWKEKVRKDASIKSLGSCYRVEKGICAKEGESIFTVEEREKVQAFIEDQLRKGYI